MSVPPDSESKRTDRIATDRAMVPFVPAPAVRSGFAARRGLWIAAVGFGLGLGAVGLEAARHTSLWPRGARPDATALLLHQLQDEVGHLGTTIETLRASADASRQDDTVRGLKRSVDQLKQEIEQVRSSDTTTFAQLSTKLDKVDREPAPKPVDTQAQQRFAELASRVERVERQVASTVTTGSIPAPTPASPPAARPGVANPAKVAAATAVKPDPVASSTEAKASPPKPPTVDAWVVRDVYDGMALVEARRGGLREVEPGEFLPGAGQVRSIERRGRAWVVLTSRGVIANDTF